jgi:protein O-GlcNAc transferase
VTNAKLAQAIEEHRRGNLRVAEAFYRDILSENPNDSDAMHLLGVIAIQCEDLPSAIVLIERAIAIQPKAEYYGNLGVGLEKMNRLGESEQAYEKALGIKPDYIDALLNLGVVHSRQRDFPKAIATYTKATQLAPLSFKAWHNLGIAHSEFGNARESLIAFDQASRIDPNDANVYANMGLVYVTQCESEAAKDAFERALSLDSKHVQANKQLAILYRSQEQYDEAIQFARQSLVHSNNDLECKLLLVDLLQRTHAWDGLIDDLKPEAIAEELLGKTIFLTSDEETSPGKQNNDFAIQSLPLVAPLSILSLHCEVAPQVSFAFAKRWAASQSVGGVHLRSSRVSRNATSGKIRVGYLSADFRSHPVGFCLAELIESHDRTRFEVFGYSIGYDDGSEIRQRLKKAFDHWIDLSPLSVQAAAERIRANEIDILIDLQGYTEGARTQILSLRPAPIQVNYLGFPGTMGADFIDYILVDEYVSPKENRKVFQETPIYLPGCYLPRDSQRTKVEVHRTRSEIGLPDNAFVFCAFSSPHKITSEVFDCWLRVLSQVPASVLWLRSSNSDADDRLLSRASKHGIETDRLIFAPIVSMQEHLARSFLGYVSL